MLENYTYRAHWDSPKYCWNIQYNTEETWVTYYRLESFSATQAVFVAEYPNLFGTSEKLSKYVTSYIYFNTLYFIGQETMSTDTVTPPLYTIDYSSFEDHGFVATMTNVYPHIFNVSRAVDVNFRPFGKITAAKVFTSFSEETNNLIL